MSADAKERAEDVAAMPHVQAWCRRFRKLCKDIPAEVWVFSESGSPYVMARPPDGNVYERSGSHAGCMDPDAIVDDPPGQNRWDGGGW